MIFYQDQRGKRGEKEERCFAKNFLCSQRNFFIQTSFFIFEFIFFCNSKNRTCKQFLPQRNPTKFPNVTSEELVDSQVFGSR